MIDYSTLSTLLADDIQVFVLDSIPSTNDYLVHLPCSDKTQVCIAREQTAGKGQYGRVWQSKKDSSLLLSIRHNFPPTTPLNGLSLVVGLAVIATLKTFGVIGLKLKWPNDIYYKKQKLAGILLENSVMGRRQSVVVGVGINHCMGKGFVCQTPWTDLSQILGNALNQADLSKHLIKQILEYFAFFVKNGFAGFIEAWNQVDYLRGKRVLLTDTKATCIGVNEQGFLLVSTENGVETFYSSKGLSVL